MVRRKVENLLREQPQNDHVVLAYRKTRVAGGYDFVDKGGPVVRPFLLEYRDEDKVELVEEGSLLLEGFLGVGDLYDETNHKVPDTLALLRWQDLPARGDYMVQDLQS